MKLSGRRVFIIGLALLLLPILVVAGLYFRTSFEESQPPKRVVAAAAVEPEATKETSAKNEFEDINEFVADSVSKPETERARLKPIPLVVKNKIKDSKSSETYNSKTRLSRSQAYAESTVRNNKNVSPNIATQATTVEVKPVLVRVADQVDAPGPQQSLAERQAPPAEPVSEAILVKQTETVPEQKLEPKLEPKLVPQPETLRSQVPKKDPEFWIWLGVGETYLSLSQKTKSQAVPIKFQNILGPVLYFAGGVQGERFGVEFTHRQFSGKVEAPLGATSQKDSFEWKAITSEMLYKLGESSWRLRAGLDVNTVPYMSYDQANSLLMVKSNLLSSLMIGFDHSYLMSEKMMMQWYLKFRHPLGAGGDGFSSASVSGFGGMDASAGFNYKVSENFRMGLHWYAQYSQYLLNVSSNSQSDEVENSIIRSQAELRIGFEF